MLRQQKPQGILRTLLNQRDFQVRCILQNDNMTLQFRYVGDDRSLVTKEFLLATVSVLGLG